MCSGHSISGRSNTTGVLWSEMPSKIGNNLRIESPRTDAGGVMRLSSHFVLPLCGMSVFSRKMQKGRGLLYFLRGWYKQEVECHRHWPLGKKSSKIVAIIVLLRFLAKDVGDNGTGNSRTSIAVQRKLQKAGGLVGKKQWEFVGEACCHLARGCKRLRLEHLTRAARPNLTWAI